MPPRTVPYSQNPFRPAVAIALLLALGVAVVKGNSLDEFWTLAFANDRVPFATAFEAWTRDSGHPVGYYFLSRLLDPILPDVILVRRLSNLLFIGLLIGFVQLCKDTRFAWFFTFVLLTQTYVVERFTEYRATFGGLIFLAILVLGLREDWQRNRITWTSSIPVIALVGAMLLDYPVGLAGVALCAAWLLAAFATKRYKQGAIAAGAIVAGMLTMGLGLLNSNRYPLLSPPYTQLALTLVKDMAIMLAVSAAPLALPIAANLVALRGKPSDAPSPERITFLTILALALAMTVVGYFVINVINHGMIRRQLIALSPLTAALACEIFWRTSAEKNWRLASGVIVCPLLVALVTPFWLYTKTGFDTFGEQLASAQRACPTLPIYGFRPADIGGAPYPDPFTGIADPVDVGLPLTAKTHGFRLSGSPRRVDPACGAIVWTEFYRDTGLTPRQVADRAGIAATPDEIARSHVEYVDHSFMLIVPGTAGGTKAIHP